MAAAAQLCKCRSAEVWCCLFFFAVTCALTFIFFSSFSFHIISAIKWCTNSTKLVRFIEDFSFTHDFHMISQPVYASWSLEVKLPTTIPVGFSSGCYPSVHWCLRPGDSVTIMLSHWHNLSMHTVENKPDMKPWIFGPICSAFRWDWLMIPYTTSLIYTFIKTHLVLTVCICSNISITITSESLVWFRLVWFGYTRNF